MSASEIHSAKTCKRPQTGLHAALPFRIYDYLPTPFVTDQPLYGWTMQLQHTLLYPRSSVSCCNTAPRQRASIENPPLTLRPPLWRPNSYPWRVLALPLFLSDEKVSYTSSQKVAISEGNGKSALRSFCNASPRIVWSKRRHYLGPLSITKDEHLCVFYGYPLSFTQPRWWRPAFL